MQLAMANQENAPNITPISDHRAMGIPDGKSSLEATTARAFLAAAGIALASIAASGLGTEVAVAVGLILATLYAWDAHRRSERQRRALAAVLESVRDVDPSSIDVRTTGDLAAFIA